MWSRVKTLFKKTHFFPKKTIVFQHVHFFIPLFWNEKLSLLTCDVNNYVSIKWSFVRVCLHRHTHSKDISKTDVRHNAVIPCRQTGSGHYSGRSGWPLRRGRLRPASCRWRRCQSARCYGSCRTRGCWTWSALSTSSGRSAPPSLNHVHGLAYTFFTCKHKLCRARMHYKRFYFESSNRNYVQHLYFRSRYT